MKNTLAIVLLLNLVACNPKAGDAHAATAAPLAEPPSGEQLMAEAPTGWVQGTATRSASLKIVEFLRPEQGDGAGFEKVTFESFTTDDPLDPIDFVVDIAEEQTDSCADADHVNVHSSEENGYPTSVRLILCPEKSGTGMGQVTLIKAIQGNDYFYVVTRTRLVRDPEEDAEPISDAEMAVWSSYMRTIRVCDTRGAEHPC